MCNVHSSINDGIYLVLLSTIQIPDSIIRDEKKRLTEYKITLWLGVEPSFRAKSNVFSSYDRRVY